MVEDDYDSEFRYGAGAIPALQGLDSQARVVHIGTFGRTLFAGLRLGYLVVPPALRDAFRAVKWLTDRGSSELEQCALAAFIETGAYESARRRISRVLGEKRRTLLEAHATHLPSEDVTWSEAATGTHVFLRLHRIKARATDAFVEYAQRCGVRVYSGASYHLRRPRCATLLCGYTTIPITAIALGTRRLAKAYGAFGDRKGG